MPRRKSLLASLFPTGGAEGSDEIYRCRPLGAHSKERLRELPRFPQSLGVKGPLRGLQKKRGGM